MDFVGLGRNSYTHYCAIFEKCSFKLRHKKMSGHKVFIIFVENGQRTAGVAPLEFDQPDQPFVVYQTGQRSPLNPEFLEKLKAPINGAEYYYKKDIPVPKSGKN